MSSWQTVKSRTEEKKKAKEEARKADVKKDRLGVPVSGPFADFDREYADKAATEAKEKHGSYAGAFSSLEDERPVAVDEDSDSEPGSPTDDGPASAASTNGTASPAKVKAPKVKRPKVTVASVAAGIDVAGLQTFIAELQQRYAASETSQLEMLSDHLLKLFRDVPLEFNKGLAEKPLDRMTDVPLSELPQPLLNALASFVAQCGGPALRQVVVTLLKATFEGLPEGARATAGVQPPKPKVGLLIVLASILRSRPEVLLLAAPDMLALGRSLSAAGRLPQLLWVLSQAAAADPAVAVAVWVRLLLPQLLGAELPSSSKAAKGTGADASAAAAAGAAAGGQGVRALEGACVSPAVSYLQELLQCMPGSSADVALGDGQCEAVVPGAAVELVSRLAFEGPSSSSAAAVQLRGLHGQLLAVAGRSGAPAQYAEWLPLALDTAGQSQAAPDTASSDPLVVRASQSVVSCLLASDWSFGVWESKHKAHLRGSARVLKCMQRRPELLQPLAAVRPKGAALHALMRTLPARHRAQLAQGKGWQGACARTAEDACADIARQRRFGRGARAGSSNGGGSGWGLGLLGAAAMGLGVMGVAAWHRAEVNPLVSHYVSEEIAEKLDAAVLQPLQQQLVLAVAAAVPLVEQAAQVVRPYAAAAQKAAEPHVVRLQGVVEPVWQQLVAAGTPLLAHGKELVQHAQEQLEEIWQRAKQQ